MFASTILKSCCTILQIANSRHGFEHAYACCSLWPRACVDAWIDGIKHRRNARSVQLEERCAGEKRARSGEHTSATDSCRMIPCHMLAGCLQVAVSLVVFVSSLLIHGLGLETLYLGRLHRHIARIRGQVVSVSKLVSEHLTPYRMLQAVTHTNDVFDTALRSVQNSPHPRVPWNALNGHNQDRVLTHVLAAQFRGSRRDSCAARLHFLYMTIQMQR